MMLNNCLFLKLGVRIETFPANTNLTVNLTPPCTGLRYTQPILAQFCSILTVYYTIRAYHLYCVMKRT